MCQGYEPVLIEAVVPQDAPPGQLYDLSTDLYQTKNVYREHPEVVKELKALLQSYAGSSSR